MERGPLHGALCSFKQALCRASQARLHRRGGGTVAAAGAGQDCRFCGSPGASAGHETDCLHNSTKVLLSESRVGRWSRWGESTTIEAVRRAQILPRAGQSPLAPSVRHGDCRGSTSWRAQCDDFDEHALPRSGSPWGVRRAWPTASTEPLSSRPHPPSRTPQSGTCTRVSRRLRYRGRVRRPTGRCREPQRWLGPAWPSGSMGQGREFQVFTFDDKSS